MTSYSDLTVVAGNAIEATWGNKVRDAVVLVFATAAARDSAITSPTEGMFVYLQDTKSLWVHNGTTWRPAVRTLIGRKYSTAGTLATSSSYGTEVAMTAWGGGDANVAFPTGMIFELELTIDSQMADSARGAMDIAIHKAVNSTANTWYTWRRVGVWYADPIAENLKCLIKNVSGSTITTSLGLGVTTVEGGGNALIIGNATRPCLLAVYQLPTTTAEDTNLAAAAVAVT